MRPPSRPSRVTALVALLGLVVTLVVAYALSLIRDDQEERLLRTRTAEVAQVLDQAVSSIDQRLRSQGAALRASGRQVDVYEAVTRTDPGLARGRSSYAWLRAEPGGFRVLAAVGPDLQVGAVVSGNATEVLQRALRVPGLAVSDVDTSAPGPRIRFAAGAGVAPAGTVVLQQNAVGAAPASRTSDGPFAELDVAAYATQQEAAGQLLLSTTTKVPLRGNVQRTLRPAGDQEWLLVVRPQAPLVGRLAQSSPWVGLAVGAVLTALAIAAVESVRRRRLADQALQAIERGAVERLQRALLPTLPQLPELDVSARYLAGTAGQQVGGDWFDVFPLPDGQVGVVIGDVIGHDLAAAGAMAQVRAALRAYALQGASPEQVLDQLDGLVSTFEIAGLVTVVYAVLGPRTAAGTRTLCWCNAGHLPPVLRAADGTTEVLDGASDLLLGTPVRLARSGDGRVLGAGSTLLLYTDGLVEVPGGSLDDAIAALSDRLARLPSSADADAMCSRMVDGLAAGARRDDVAVLAVRLT